MSCVYDLINDTQPITFTATPLSYYQTTLKRLTKECEDPEDVYSTYNNILDQCRTHLKKLSEIYTEEGKTLTANYQNDDKRCLVVMAFTACYHSWKNEALLFPNSTSIPKERDLRKAYELGAIKKTYDTPPYNYKMNFDDPTTIYAQVYGRLCSMFLIAFKPLSRVLNPNAYQKFKKAKSVATLLTTKHDGKYPVINIEYFETYLRKVMSKRYNSYPHNICYYGETCGNAEFEDMLVDALDDYFDKLLSIASKCSYLPDTEFTVFNT